MFGCLFWCDLDWFGIEEETSGSFLVIVEIVDSTIRPRRTRMKECTPVGLPKSEKRLRELGMLAIDLKGLSQRLRELPDQRGDRGKRYELASLLLLVILAKLSGKDTPVEIADWVRFRASWLFERLGLPWPSSPHHNTFRRVLAFAFDSSKLDRLVSQHLTALAGSAKEGRSGTGEKLVDRLIAFDGKTIRGTISKDNPRGDHLLAAYLVETGAVIAQVRVESKQNEITAAPRLLELIDQSGVGLKGKILIGDAIHTQRKLSQMISQSGGDFVFTAKGNQPDLKSAIRDLFEIAPTTVLGGKIRQDFQSFEQIGKAHGRLEKRRITVSSELSGYSSWPGLRQVFRLERERTQLVSGRLTREVIYGITSLGKKEASPRELLELVRSYWRIENCLHYCRDKTFKEDATRGTIGRLGHSLASINNLAIGLLRASGFTNIKKARRTFDGLLNQTNHLALEPILT